MVVNYVIFTFFIRSQSSSMVINFYSTSYPTRTLFGWKVLAFPKIVTTQNHKTSLLTSPFATSMTVSLYKIVVHVYYI